MNMVTMTAPAPWPRIERAGWFWIFVALSVAAHAAFFWRVSWERAAVAVDAAPQVMAVRMVEVRPAPPEPVVEPEPVVMPPVVEPEPVLTRLPEPAVLPPPPKPAAAVVKPKPAPPKVASPAPVRPDAPAFVEARPTATANRPPHYPDLARRNGWQGLCMVRVTVNENGRPGAVSLARSSGYGILDQAALTAVRRWKFTPRMVRGVPAASTVEVPVNFSLR
jgi:protein TonB